MTDSAQTPTIQTANVFPAQTTGAGGAHGGSNRPAPAAGGECELAILDARVAQAWERFGENLAATLGQLPPGTELDLVLDPAAAGTSEAVYAVSVAAREEGDLVAYAVSNTMLSPEHRLPSRSVAALVALGWEPPGVVEGSGERYGLRASAEESGQLTAILIRTLRGFFGAPHPAFLLYAAQAAWTATDGPPPEADYRELPEATEPAEQTGQKAPPVEPPGPAAEKAAVEPPGPVAEEAAGEPPEPAPELMLQLHPARPVPAGRMILPLRHSLEGMPLAAKVATVIAAMLGTAPENLPVDEDGDIGIRSGSAMVFIRVRDEPPLVDVFSPVLTQVNANERLYKRLSELNHRMPIGRLYCVTDTVWASVPVFGREFQATHLMVALKVMTGLADELDDRLQGEFGGRRFFADEDGSTLKPPDGEGRIGMYL